MCSENVPSPRAEQNGTSYRAGDGQVEVPIVVEVACRELVGKSVEVDVEALGGAEGPVALAQQDEDGITAAVAVRHREVGGLVGVEEAHHHRIGGAPGPEHVVGRGSEGSVTRTEEHRDVARAAVRQYQVRVAVPVEVTDGHRIGPAVTMECIVSEEAAAAVTQQHVGPLADEEEALVGGGHVDARVAVEVACHHRDRLKALDGALVARAEAQLGERRRARHEPERDHDRAGDGEPRAATTNIRADHGTLPLSSATSLT